VKALEGVSFDMWEGETLGLVGETGCGKSVTALSILRLIPQPPGKIEEGDILFDVPPEKLEEIERLEARVGELLPKALGDVPDARPPDLAVKRLQPIVDSLKRRTGGPRPMADRNALVAAATELIKVKRPYDLISKSDKEMRQIRGNRIAMIFQEPMQALNPVFPIGDQIAENIALHQRKALAEAVTKKLEAGERYTTFLPRGFLLAYYRGVRAKPNRRPLPILRRLMERPLQKEALLWAVEMLRKVKISDPERIARQYPYELSGGMQQRSVIAIALSCNPRLLIADEPTTALDVTIQAQILELIKDMKTTFGSSVLIITHDLGIIAEMCHRVCVMYAGIIAEDAEVRKVFKAPLHPYTQGLMKAIPSHAVRRERLEIIRGSVPNLITPPPGCRFHPRCPEVMPTCGWSPAEVADALRGLARTPDVASWWPMDPDAMFWTPSGETELRIGFPEGAVPANAVELVRRLVGAGQSNPAIGAIVSVESAAPAIEGEAAHQVRVTVITPRKPPAFEPEPGHRVACLLYEPGRRTDAILEEVRGG